MGRLTFITEDDIYILFTLTEYIVTSVTGVIRKLKVRPAQQEQVQKGEQASVLL